MDFKCTQNILNSEFSATNSFAIAQEVVNQNVLFAVEVQALS